MILQSIVLASVASLASAATYNVQVGGLNGDTPILKFNPPVRTFLAPFNAFSDWRHHSL
jgi:hypothetical protein